jgi:hypothetical protein
VTKDGVASEVSGASAVLYNSGSTEKATPIPVISGAENNILTTTILDTYYTVIEENCRIEWTFSVDGKEQIYNNLFDVVNYKIVNPVITADLVAMHPDLTVDLWDTQDNFQPQIDEAYESVKTDIKNKGNRPALLVDMSQLTKPLKYNALSVIFWGQFVGPGDRWMVLAQKADEDYDTEFSKTVFKYDSTGDGPVSVDRTFGNIPWTR